MKHVILSACFLVACTFSLFAQTDSVDLVAKRFIRAGDYDNAIVVLNQGLRQDGKNLTLLKDLAFTYYLQKNYSSAVTTAKPLIERPDADVECYQILGLAYKAAENRKECEKMYRDGIKRFPNSGQLYNEYGEMLWSRKDYGAIKLWEKGIELDPNYSLNYYNAARYYYPTPDKVWSLVYAEIFVNLESYSKRTLEVRDLILDGYRKLYSDPNILKNENTKNRFVDAFITELNKQSAPVANGLTVETLTLVRKNFAMDWADKMNGQLPFRLFDYHNQLIKLGLFDAYNQWLFYPGSDDPGVKKWMASHSDEYNRFIAFQKGRIFKLPEGQYYHGVVK